MCCVRALSVCTVQLGPCTVYSILTQNCIKWVKQDLCIHTDWGCCNQSLKHVCSYVSMHVCRCIKCVLAHFCLSLSTCVRACAFVHFPACVYTPGTLERYRECQEAMEAAEAWGAWLSVDSDETGQLHSSGARYSIRHRLDLNIALEHWSCLPVPPRLCGALAQP